VDAAIAGTGVIYHFEDWLRPHLDSGTLEPVLHALTGATVSQSQLDKACGTGVKLDPGLTIKPC
jgi:hypothetical protein